MALPWNTTKTGVDSSNRLYILAREKMKEAMRQIFKKIKEAKTKYSVTDLESLDFVKKAPMKELTYSTVSNINKESDFDIGEPIKPTPMTKVIFSKPTEEVEKVKSYMGESTNKAMGEHLFDYYCEMEEL